MDRNTPLILFENIPDIKWIYSSDKHDQMYYLYIHDIGFVVLWAFGKTLWELPFRNDVMVVPATCDIIFRGNG